MARGILALAQKRMEELDMDWDQLASLTRINRQNLIEICTERRFEVSYQDVTAIAEGLDLDYARVDEAFEETFEAREDEIMKRFTGGT